MLTGRVLVVAVIISSIVLLLGARGHGGWAQAQDGDRDESGASESVTLELEGEEGASFTGSCSVGEERREIRGQVPKSYEFDVEDERLSCEVRTEDGQNQALEVTLSGEGSRSVQRIEGGEGVVRLTYQGGAVSSSMSSASSSSGGGRTTPEDDSRGSLADRIQERVDEILERVVP